MSVLVSHAVLFFFFLMIRRPPRSTLSSSSAASDVYKRQAIDIATSAVGRRRAPQCESGECQTHADRLLEEQPSWTSRGGALDEVELCVGRINPKLNELGVERAHCVVVQLLQLLDLITQIPDGAVSLF
eukprot:TRINITY_DN2002_c0_g1_i6.p1 TRINITY_DN2002_c0_g1~~TRINITY_DN2002_c0_g1_i6.p1  ORF type:complete len:129 (-),score=23.92 TRINITY_DN2002_c0_g1_i6:223-609(-)